LIHFAGIEKGRKSLKQLIEVFYAPGKVFDYVRDRKAWVIATLANVLLISFTIWFYYQTIGAENMARHQFENSKFAAQMSDDQKQQAIAAAASPTREAVGIVVGGVFGGVFILVVGLLFMAIAGVSGHSIKFSQGAGTAAYAGWPVGVIKVLLSVVVVLAAADKTDLDPQHLLAFNIGAFLDQHTTAKPLYALASSLDIFILAQVLLGAYGLSRVANITFGKAAGGMIAIWVVLTIIAMGLSLVF
jgi:hypothetical protein